MMHCITIYPCDPGTEIINGDERLTVENGSAVQCGGYLYISRDDYEALKSHPKVKAA